MKVQSYRNIFAHKSRMNTICKQRVIDKNGFLKLLVLFATSSFGYLGAQTSSNSFKYMGSAKNLGIYSGIILHAGVNYVIEKKLPSDPIKMKQFRTFLDNPKVCALNKTPVKISDASILVNLGIGLASSLAASKNNGAIMLTEWTQSILITSNITQSFKIGINRGRPYTFGKPVSYFSKKDDAYSFFSGHSSISAATSTTLWLNRSKISHNPKLNTLICTSSTLFSVATAGLRLKANKHYPSDVLLGLATGTLISFGVHAIHAKF